MYSSSWHDLRAIDVVAFPLLSPIFIFVSKQRPPSSCSGYLYFAHACRVRHRLVFIRGTQIISWDVPSSRASSVTPIGYTYRLNKRPQVSRRCTHHLSSSSTSPNARSFVVPTLLLFHFPTLAFFFGRLSASSIASLSLAPSSPSAISASESPLPLLSC